MPLLKGKSNVGNNIKKLMLEGRSQKQSIAIAMDVAGIRKKVFKKKLKGGK